MNMKQFRRYRAAALQGLLANPNLDPAPADSDGIIDGAGIDGIAALADKIATRMLESEPERVSSWDRLDDEDT